jgi:hypothetical protein
MKAYKHLVKFALSNGMTVSVWDGEAFGVKRSSSFKEINDCVESVEVAELTIRDTNGEKQGWAMVAAFGFEEDETVMDHTMTAFLHEWDFAYRASQYA